MNIFSSVARKLTKLNKCYHRFGIIVAIKLLLSKLSDSKMKLITISLPELKYPIKLRTDSSDLDVIEQIFIDEDYNFTIDSEPKLIIDGGAYVGYSAVFFANKFPEAKIIALEPEDSNFKLLEENTRNYKNIELVKAGIWHKPAHLRIKDMGLGHFGFMVEEVTDQEEFSFEAITIGEILQRSGYRGIDILKLDIEGSEKEVFSHAYENWLNLVNVLIVELHDRIKPGCSEAFYCAVNLYNFIKYQRGENIILMKY